MPITRENLKRYPKDWRAISDRIKARSGGRCECNGECGLHRGRRCCETHGEPARWAKGKVILTVAHLDHQPENCGEKNLKAMCQRCHNRYDMPNRRVNASRTRDRKCGQRRFEEIHG